MERKEIVFLFPDCGEKKEKKNTKITNKIMEALPD
jgi:hypothetical protein